MSTRVHELAKELGLKSPELLERIQKWGLDVKASALASLDPPMVDRIKQLMAAPSSSSAPAASKSLASASAPAASPGPAPAAKPAHRPTPSETPAISSSATAESRQSTGPSARPAVAAVSSPPPAPPVTPPLASAGPSAVKSQNPAASVAPATPARPLGATPPVQAPISGAAPVPPAHLAQGAGAGTATGHAPAPGPLSNRGGLTSPPRSGGGPLSGHTPHRSAAPGAPQRPATPPSPQHDLRPNPSTPPPLKRSDYISPTGTRQPVGRPLGPQGGGSGGGSQTMGRPRDDSGGGGEPRRDSLSGRGTSRPLPPVATANNPPPQARRPGGSGGPGAHRPGGGPEVKTQRPEKRYTPEELRAMMLSGQLGGAGGGTATQPNRTGSPGRPGGPGLAGGGRPAGGPGSGLTGRPGGPPGPPAMRRPLTGGVAAPVAPPPVISEEEDERKKGAARLGTPADRAGRRAKRTERAADRRVTSPVSTAVILNETEEEAAAGTARGPASPEGGGHRQALAPSRKSHAEIEPPINLRSLSEAIGVPVKDLIKRLMNNMGQMVTINANLDEESAQMLALEFGVELEVVHERTAEDAMLESFESEAASEDLVARPPVITILGHVDHGKTSLLDRIRKANVVQTESGGITQHIGAYTVQHDGHPITFVDTPGHEAFTAMRARGANVTDIVVLVVAADDGVMPQTQEAIAHAKAAEVPIVVALNKIDLPNVNLNKIYGELSQQGLVPEEYGGDTPVVKTSALTGLGIDDLLGMLQLVADLHADDLRANPKRLAKGTCLEASISEGRGVVATVLVQDGTLKVGDVMVCGDGFGRVRALFDDKGRSVTEAGPSMPVEVSGLDEVPTAGEKFAVVDDISHAREIAEGRRFRTRGVALGERQSITLENLYSKMAEQKVKSLNLILKADVQGSLEALTKELEKLENAEVPLRVLLKGVGGISESDILLADASQAIVIGFRVAPDDSAVSLADEKNIEIRRYDIIYQVTDEIKKAVEGMLVPEIKEVHLGRAVVRQVFKISKVGAVAGCFVTQGTIERAAKARIIREGREIYKGTIEALKRFKDDVKEVREGFECGIKISNFDDLKTDDVIEAYRIDEIRRTL